MRQTEQRCPVGANATFALSSRMLQMADKVLIFQLYRFLGGVSGNRLPVPMMNIVNGGCHALSSGLDVQEFMVMLVGAPSLREGLRWCSEVFHALASFYERGLATSSVMKAALHLALASDEEGLSKRFFEAVKAGYEPEKIS